VVTNLISLPCTSVTKPPSVILEKSWQSGETLVTAKKALSHTFLKGVERMTKEITDQ